MWLKQKPESITMFSILYALWQWVMSGEVQWRYDKWDDEESIPYQWRKYQYTVDTEITDPSDSIVKTSDIIEMLD